MTKINLEQYKPMIARAVRALKPRDFDTIQDLTQEANLIFYETLAKYDPDKAQFGTLLYTNLKQLNYRYWYKMQDKAYLFGLNQAEAVESRSDQPGKLDSLEPFDTIGDVDLNLSFLELTPDAQKLHQVITSGDLVTDLGKQLRLTFQNLLNVVKEWGWDGSRLKEALDDLKEYICELFDTQKHGATMGYNV